MKEILGIGLLILVAVVGLRVGGSGASSIDRESTRGDAVGLQIYSAALGHQPQRYIARRTPIAIIVNGAYRNGDLDEPGLRVVAIRSGTSGSMHNFQLADSEQEIARFEAFCGSAKPGTVLAMGVYRTASPSVDDTSAGRATLEQLFASLGAQRPPTAVHNASWAFLCVRTETGWTPIAEAVSTTKGVHLARTLNTSTLGLTQANNPPRKASLLIDEWDEVSFIDRFAQATLVTGTTQFTAVRRASNNVAGGTLDAIFAHPPYGELRKTLGHPENRLAWDAIDIPDGGLFQAQLGIASWAVPKSDGVVFQVVIDDLLVASKGVGIAPFSPDTWVPWTVDLSAYWGQTVRFELRVAPNASPNADHALWGDPIIQYPAN